MNTKTISTLVEQRIVLENMTDHDIHCIPCSLIEMVYSTDQKHYDVGCVEFEIVDGKLTYATIADLMRVTAKIANHWNLTMSSKTCIYLEIVEHQDSILHALQMELQGKTVATWKPKLVISISDIAEVPSTE